MVKYRTDLTLFLSFCQVEFAKQPYFCPFPPSSEGQYGRMGCLAGNAPLTVLP